ncbi:MAG: hypothetical protein AB2689_07395, partial [Candidatus Thiodiazotropha taylori]
NHQTLLKINGYYAKLHSYQNHTPVLRQVPVKPLKPIQVEGIIDERTTKNKPTTKHQYRADNLFSEEEVDESWALDLLDEQEREALLNEIKSNDNG